MMLTERFKRDDLRIVSQADWTPYPKAADRAAWEVLPLAVRDLLIARGEAALQMEWKALLATRFLEYARVGNRSNYEAENFGRRNQLIALALAECAEGQGRFVHEIVNGLWLICEETYWGLPAHLHLQGSGPGLPDAAEPTVDLFAAETAAALAHIDYLLGDALDGVSPLIRPRIAAEIDRRILTPNLEREDFGWMGFQREGRPNNWNPWINSNWLACVLFIERDPQRRLDAVAKIMRSLDFFIDPYPADGGCDEGPGYWMRAAASLYECLEQLHQATNGQVDVFGESLIQEMGRFIYRVHIDDHYYINFADASAIVIPESHLIFRYGQAIGDRDMAAFGAWAARNTPDGGAGSWGRPIESPMRWLRAIFSEAEIAGAEAYAPQPRDVWLPNIEVMVARDHDRSGDGLYVAAKGGHNNESHNHNDIGEFVVYRDGLPLLIDAGVETYSRKTFSPQRYEIWTMQSAYHNLPTIDGVQQAPGKQFAARDVRYLARENQAELVLDIAGAYPPEAGLKRWLRTIRLNRGQSVAVEDEYELDHTPGTLGLSLLTACAVSLDTAGIIRLSAADLPDGRVTGSGFMHYDAGQFTPSIETIPITDLRMSKVWGESLCRILLTARTPRQQGTWKLEISEA
ncbi:MAG: heparinase II/III-family protein [Anaerolineae bacterium]|nr:heparinase II/III-family protein [Anaerolineae bacterium]